MDKLIVLGTGHAGVTQCYNTCFVLNHGDEYILVDAGGGNGILSNLDKARIPFDRIHHAFLTHAHTDHLLGMVWIIRIAGHHIVANKYEGNLNIYGHQELLDDLETILKITLDPKIQELIGTRILLNPVVEGQKSVLGPYEFTFFDIHSSRAKQFAFTTLLKNNKKLAFLGDESYNSLCHDYVADSDWLLGEAFCLDSQSDIFRKMGKYHSSVKETCEVATMLKAKNLVLWHTEDHNLAKRRELYTAEGREYYQGNLYVPDDLDVITL